MNTICEDKGDISLVDEKSCKDAVEKIKNTYLVEKIKNTYFYKISNDSSFPKGCNLLHNGDAAYLNLRESGARSEYARPICKIVYGT